MKRRWVMKFWVGAGILSLLCGSVSFAAESSNEGTVFRMGEVVVTGEAGGVESVGTVYRITEAEIKTRGARTLDEALELVPGLIVRIGGSGTPRIDIRGFRTRHVQLLLDGIPVNDTYDAQFDPTTFPVEYIAEIKVTTGGGSVLYGTGGNGGVINIVTKKGREGVSGTVTGEAGEGDRYIGRATLSGGTGAADAFVGLSLFDRDNYPVSGDFDETADEDGDERENSDLTRGSIFANFGYAFTGDTQLGFVYNHTWGENGVPGRVNYDRDDPFSQRPRYERVDDIQSDSAQLSLDHRMDGPFSLRGWAFFNQQELEENRYDNGDFNTQAERGARGQESTTRVAGANIQVKYAFPEKGGLTLGLSGENHDWDADGFEVNRDEEREFFEDDRDLQVYSTALEAELFPIDKLGLVVGYGHHFQEKDGGSGANDFSYLFGAWYDLTDETRLRASHSRKIRFPSIRQLNDVGTGNEDLDAERSLHWEGGVEQTLPAETQAWLVGYYTKSKDFIERDDTDFFQNYEEYRFQGVEIGVENRFVENLMVRATYSFLDTENRSPGNDRAELQHRPEDKFTLETAYTFSFGLTAYASLLHVADQVFYDRDNEPPLEQRELGDFTVVDLKLTQTLLNDRLDLYAGVENLFDEDYEESYGLPQPGRVLYAGVEYRF
jgi:outer membrane cobalamin receptor